MVRKKKADPKRPIASYEHTDKKRVNNPPVGLVTPGSDPDAGAKKTYAYDLHLDPQLQWAGEDRNPRILFLADRNVLRDQVYNTFEPFEDEYDIIAERFNRRQTWQVN